MSIILEGPDNSGKTTLCKDLQKMCPDVQAFHPGGRPDEKDVERLLSDQLVKATRSDLIIDRVTAISERVYREGMLDDPRYVTWAKLACRHETCGVVYCKPPIDNLLNRESISFREEEDEETRHRVLDNLHLYVERYEHVMTDIPHIVYDYANELEAGWIRKYLVDALNRQDFGDLQIIARARKVY